MKGSAIALAGAGLLALLFVGLATTRNRAVAKRDVQAAAVANHDLPAVLSPRASPESIPRVAATALREKIERGEVRVIDVRDADSYMASHIPGALQIPLSYIESEVPYLRGPIPIVTYCT
jgi:Rhodanese-like domain